MKGYEEFFRIWNSGPFKSASNGEVKIENELGLPKLLSPIEMYDDSLTTNYEQVHTSAVAQGFIEEGASEKVKKALIEWTKLSNVGHMYGNRSHVYDDWSDFKKAKARLEKVKSKCTAATSSKAFVYPMVITSICTCRPCALTVFS